MTVGMKEGEFGNSEEFSLLGMQSVKGILVGGKEEKLG